MKSVLLSFAARFILLLVKALSRTCRFELHGFEKARTTFKTFPSITAFWHNRVILSPYIINRFVSKVHFFAVISKSRDADILASAISSFRTGSVLRVAHNKRHITLKRIIENLEQHKNLIITPDGPKGPKYTLKPGTLYVASKSGAYICPFSWSVSRSWKLNTWDGIEIPKPFSKIVCVFGAPRQYTNTKEDQKKLLKAMQEVTEESERLVNL